MGRLQGDEVEECSPDAGAQLPRRLAARSSGSSKFVPPLAISPATHVLAAILNSSSLHAVGTKIGGRVRIDCAEKYVVGRNQNKRKEVERRDGFAWCSSVNLNETVKL